MILEAIFVSAAGVLVYTFAGYPALAFVWSRLAPARIRKGAGQPYVAVAIIVHDAERHIGEKLASCLNQRYPPSKLRIVLVSDGSTDRTIECVRRMDDPRITLIDFPTRRGKAACLNDAAAACHEDVIVFTDARQPLHPDAVQKLVENLADPAVGAVSGRLALHLAGTTDFGEALGTYWRYEVGLRAAEGMIHSVVGVSGALYCIRRECFAPIPVDTILDDVLLPMNVVLGGKRVVFEAESLAYDTPSPDLGQERRRKVRTLAGNFQLLVRNPQFLLPWRNPIALQFVSHKVMRLMAPFALVAALASSALLAPSSFIFLAFLLAQAVLYTLAIVGWLWPGAAAIKAIRLPMAFVALNWFVVLGLLEFASNRKAHLWKTK